jgi:hypothetical protein
MVFHNRPWLKAMGTPPTRVIVVERLSTSVPLTWIIDVA